LKSIVKKFSKKISSKIVHRNHWFTISENKITRPDGSRGKYFILHKEPGVNIIPFDGRNVYLINQYRLTLKKRSWEFPAGKSENHNYLFQAKKELREETGLRAGKWKYLGEFACGPGITSHMGKVYLAEKLKQGDPEREPGEIGMIVKKFSIPVIDRMIDSGKIIDSWTITSWHFFKQYLRRRK